MFNTIADALKRCTKEESAQPLWHYLNDFFTVSQVGTGECALYNEVLHHIYRQLGVPLATEKCEGLTKCLTFLGIAIDSLAMELHLPREIRPKGETTDWEAKRSCTKHNLQSITGLLQHAATVVHLSKAFTRQLYELLSITRAQHHRIRLNAEVFSNLAWWLTFLER